MTFHCISPLSHSKRAALLKEACAAQDVSFNHIDPATFSYVNPPAVEAGDLLYRASASTEHAGMVPIEQFLSREGVVSFYKNQSQVGYTRPESYIAHRVHNIPIPRTVHHLTSDRQQLQEYVEYVGGFPVVLKVIGGSKGIGVIKVDSYSSLYSVVDYLISNNVLVTMREFIPLEAPAYSIRAIVLGGKVVVAYRNESVDGDDFRSNVNQASRRRSIVELSEAQKELLVKSVDVLELDLGAIDLVLTADEDPGFKIFEVNFPFNFVPVVEDLHIPLHEQIVAALVAKSQQATPA